MVKLNYVFIKANHIAQILYALSHRKNNPIIAVCPGQKSKQFFSMLNVNANYKNIIPVTFQQYVNKPFENGATVVLLSAPSSFEILESILKKSQTQNHNVVLSLLHQTKKYLNIINKKISNLEISEMAYSANKFVGINDKIRDFVDKSYDMNRAGFYAYGQFINYFRSNLLKKIFRTQLINLDELARSYGFTSAQRVKQGSFLKPEAQKAQKAQKRAEKKRKNRQAKNKETKNKEEGQDVQEKAQVKIPKKTKKIAKARVEKAKKVKKAQ